MTRVSNKWLLIRADDAGLNNDTNRGIAAVLRAGVTRSVGVMACAPAFKDAVQCLQSASSCISIGVHLTLNSEWTGYRWRPLLPVSEVPTLIDDDGFLPCDHQLYRSRPPSIDHVLAEVRAQIAAVRSVGLAPCYADEHMVFTAASPWLLEPIREVVEKSGLLYDRALALPRFIGDGSSMDAFGAGLSALDGKALLVAHPAEDGPLMRQLGHDRAPPGVRARERAAELATLTDPRLPSLLAENDVEAIGYSDLY